MAGLLQLFLDLDRGLFVRNAVDPSPISPGPFTQGENVPIDLTLLRANPTGSLLIPYQIVTDASSCKFGLCTPGPSVSTIHAQATLIYNAARQLHEGELNLATAAITTLLNAANSANTTLEVEVTSPRGIRTPQKAVTVQASGLKTASTVPVPSDAYFTKAQATAVFVPRELGPGEPVVFRSPNGNRWWHWVDDGGLPHYDPVG